MAQKINPDDYEVLLKPKKSSWTHVNSTSCIFVYRKNVSYPESYVGSGIVALMRNLNISKAEARKLLVIFFKKAILMCNDEDLRMRLKQKLKEHGNILTPRNCVVCGKSFQPKNWHQKTCHSLECKHVVLKRRNEK